MLDKDMREPLFDYLEEFYGKIRILEEKNTGMSRADVIGVIDGSLIGFEIKSDGDSYTRLKTQTGDYDRLCDINYLVVGKSHRKQADKHIPLHWGILCVFEEEGAVHVEMEQIPGQNHSVELEKQVELLWRPELATLLEWNELPKYRERSKQFVRDKLVEKVEAGKLKRQITDLLFERDYELLLEKIRLVQEENRAKRGKPARRRTARCKAGGRRRASARSGV